MHRMQCVLTLLALCVGVVQPFSWDIVISRDHRLEFYNEGNFTYTANPTGKNIHWITYDPLHNRVLFKDTVEKAVFSYDIATGKTQTLINLKIYSWSLVYDPARELLFASVILKGQKSIKYFLVKPGSDAESEGNSVVNLPVPTNGLAVDSCRGYIYWTTDRKCTIEKVHINASGTEVIKDGCADSIKKTGLTIDPQTQKIYWAENKNNITVFFNADLDGSNKKTLYKDEKIEVPNQISVAKDFIYWVDMKEPFFFQLPKNASLDADVKPKRFALDDAPTISHLKAIASNYAIEEQTEGNPDCKAMQSLLPSIPTKPESRDTGDTCDISVCRNNYCLQGHCSVSADGQPECRCNAGYSGPRCEVNACLEYCLHEGVCSLNDTAQPVCRCSEGYEGARCDVSVFLSKFVQQFIKKTTSIFNEILTKADEVTAKE